MGEEKTFVRITNKDIYDEIRTFKKENHEAHKEMNAHMVKTNGNVTKNKGNIGKVKWIATTAMTLILIVIGWFISHLNG